MLYFCQRIDSAQYSFGALQLLPKIEIQMLGELLGFILLLCTFMVQRYSLEMDAVEALGLRLTGIVPCTL